MAITFEQAKEKALKYDKKYNICYEFIDGFEFHDTRVESGSAESYDEGIVVLKDSGKLIPVAEFILTTKNTSSPKKIRF